MKNILKNSLNSFIIFGTLIISIITIGILPDFFHNRAYSQEITVEYPFENATHIQYSSNGDVVSKPSIRLIMDLTRDPEGYGFSGDPYKFTYNGLQLDINDNGKLRTYWYNLTNSGSNQVSISDTQIYPSFTFRMPIGPNSTTQSVEEISQFFKVGQISPLTDGTSYLSKYGSSITLNNTSYEYPYLIVDQYSNGTATLYLVSTEPGKFIH
jgi:hypothetical protein